MTPVSSRVSNCSLTAADPRSNRKGGRSLWRDRSVRAGEHFGFEGEVIHGGIHKTAAALYPRETGLSRRATADAEVLRQGRQGEDDYRGGCQDVASFGRFEKWIGPAPGGTRGPAVGRRKWRTREL